MSTEVWFRNPYFYIRECAERRVDKIAWDRGASINKRADPVRYVDLHMPADVNYRVMWIGDQGSAEYRRGDPLHRPRAVYPTWVYGFQSLALLEELLRDPVGDNLALVRALQSSRPGDAAPVLGQEHRVLVINMPDQKSLEGKAFASVLADLQAAYPDAIVHVHGAYSYRCMFGNWFRAVDIDPFMTARRGKINLPNGRIIAPEQMPDYTTWINCLNGWSAEKIREEPRNRCLFNMDSALWAAKYYRETPDIQGIKNKNTQQSLTDAVLEIKMELQPSTYRGKKTADSAIRDKVLCEYCSIAPSCHYFREGSVCALPTTDAEKITSLFNTRNPDKILEGLTGLLEVQGQRLERGLGLEEDDNVLSPSVTRLLDSMFKQGVQLAKLTAPERFLKPGVSVNVGVAGRNNAVAIGTGPVPMHQLVASAVAALESQGYQRHQINNELIQAYLNGGEVPPPEEFPALPPTEIIDADVADG